jgi:alkylation response protein AidB-like acyl-CoA dehydrogenase
VEILTEEQQMLADAAAAWVADRAPIKSLRALRDDRTRTHDPALYDEMVAMGWTGILAPVEHGGSAFGMTGLGVVLERLGHNLVASPLIGSALGAISALTLGGTDEQKALWLPGLIDGKTIGTVAVDEAGSRDPHRPRASVSPDPSGGWRLNGIKRPVMNGMSANVAIVSAIIPAQEKQTRLFLVPLSGNGIVRRPLCQIDGLDSAVYRFENVRLAPDALLGVASGPEFLDEILDRVRAGLAAEMLGMARQAFAITIEYLKTRVQFGQPIGGFQALQHRVADLYAELELARSAVEVALSAVDAQDHERAQLVSLAKCLVGKTLRRITNEMIQLHGGIGMTDEHDAGLYLKRARVADVSFGNVAFHHERYAQLTGH